MALLGLGIEKEKMRLPKELWRVGEQESGWCHPDTAVSIGTPLILFDRYCQFAGALVVVFQKSFPKYPLYLTIFETHLAVEYLTFLYLSVVVFSILGIRQTSVLFLRNIKPNLRFSALVSPRSLSKWRLKCQVVIRYTEGGALPQSGVEWTAPPAAHNSIWAAPPLGQLDSPCNALHHSPRWSSAPSIQSRRSVVQTSVKIALCKSSFDKHWIINSYLSNVSSLTNKVCQKLTKQRPGSYVRFCPVESLLLLAGMVSQEPDSNAIILQCQNDKD